MRTAKLWDGLLHIIAKKGGNVGEAVAHEIQAHRSRFAQREQLIKEKKDRAEKIRKHRLPL